MAKILSPLRYPGGKSRAIDVIYDIIPSNTGLRDYKRVIYFKDVKKHLAKSLIDEKRLKCEST